jgi:hypothetical protein
MVWKQERKGGSNAIPKINFYNHFIFYYKHILFVHWFYLRDSFFDFVFDGK